MKNLWYFVGGGVIILLIVAIFIISSGNSKNSEKEQAEKEQADADAQKLQDAKSRADSLQIALDECCPKPKVLTVEEQLGLLRDEITTLKKSTRVTYTRSYRKPVTAPAPDVAEKSFSGSSNFVPEPTKSVSATVETFSGDNGTLSVTLYEGGYDGDYCLTIDGTGHLVYCLKNSTFMSVKPSIPAPRLNGENGPEFTFDQATGYWYYVDGRLISVQEINNYDYAIEWNVYTGQTNFGSGSYPTYIPHQMMKSLINKVRGKEWGEITDNDLSKMRAENPNVWTPTLEGTLRPFRLNSSDGRALGKEDRNMYQGWNFRTRIFAKKKITITR